VPASRYRPRPARSAPRTPGSAPRPRSDRQSADPTRSARSDHRTDRRTARCAPPVPTAHRRATPDVRRSLRPAPADRAAHARARPADCRSPPHPAPRSLDSVPAAPAPRTEPHARHLPAEHGPARPAEARTAPPCPPGCAALTHEPATPAECPTPTHHAEPRNPDSAQEARTAHAEPRNPDSARAARMGRAHQARDDHADPASADARAKPDQPPPAEPCRPRPPSRRRRCRHAVLDHPGARTHDRHAAQNRHRAADRHADGRPPRPHAG
jgi:hypothetical protein